MKYIILLFSLTLILFACKENSKPGTGDKIQELELDSIEIPEETVILPSIDMVMGKFNPAVDSNFVIIDQIYTDKTSIYLQKEAYDKFIEMHDAAAKEGVELFILSATRPFDYQRNIWERKWRQQKEKGLTDEVQIVREILKYSAMPGTSRHHWGTDIDLNYLNNHYFESGKGQIIYEWLLDNAANYGFCQPYTPKNENRPNGYEEEKWHWSYMPVAELYYKAAQNVLSDELINGFSGSDAAPVIQVVQNYVMGVDPKCR